MIDLYSDTKTRPTAAMRAAIAAAVVGDEQHGEDPTVDALNERVAQLLGKEAAVFLPSGTMANEISVLVHCRPGDEIVAHAQSHLLNFEGGAVAALAGAMVRPVQGERGMFDLATLKAAIRPRARHLPNSRLLSIEQTTNLGGGAVWPLEQIEALVSHAREQGLAAHLDGARLMNAVAASGIDAARYAAPFDTVFLDFTKGLGAPFGAVLAGSKDTIDQAWRWKQRLGGSMRQAGMMAQACIHALDHHVDRLADDHANAQLLARLLGEVKGLRVDTPETNMVFCDVSQLCITAVDFNQRLQAHGVRVSIQGPTRLRAVTHLDVSRENIEHVARAATAIVAGL
ncbi:low specificity L-threonine aldolase [Hydrogenophaga sp.]|uniref:threonine aldolase family protein n=1 Tax=Hydrogenophaga sp. TaxID=1904254 RepID=UPI0027197896|nr:threonine aldolase family protein [Hydrogenophaga sp.]MDO9435706.1 threonine aldolase family protein [Hydrogenophaga sp.]